MREEDAEGFLARWSRRKRAAAAPREAEQAPEPHPASPPAATAIAPAPPALPEPPAVAAPDLARAEPPADLPPLELPPIDSLTAESDLRPFLDPRAPPALRQAALRRMWTLDPTIRDFIGLADYAWDYNAPDGVPGFALDLGGDVTRLLAQAIGLDGEAGTGCQASAPPAAQPAPEGTPQPARKDAPDVTVALATNPPPEAAERQPPMPPEPPPLAPRRHGGARPA